MRRPLTSTTTPFCRRRRRSLASLRLPPPRALSGFEAFGPPLSSGGVRVFQGTDSREEEEIEDVEKEEEEGEEFAEGQNSSRVVSSLTASSALAWPSSSTAFAPSPPSSSSRRAPSPSASRASSKSKRRTTTLTVGRRVAAQVRVAARPSTLWGVLTDFEALPAIVPNLEACEVVKGGGGGGVGGGRGATRVAPWLSSASSRSSSKHAQPLRIRQRASSQCRWWRLEAEALLQVTWGDLPKSEQQQQASSSSTSSSSPSSSASSFSSGSRELRFEQVEGDFRELSGRWIVSPIWGDDDGGGGGGSEDKEEDASSSSLSDVDAEKKKKKKGRREPFACILTYELLAVPRWPLPPPLVSAVVAAGLPANIAALASAAEGAEAAAARPASAAAAAALEADAPLPGGGSSARSSSSSSLRWEEVEEEQASEAALAAASQSEMSSFSTTASSLSSPPPLPPPVALPAKGPPRMQAAPWPTVKARVAQLSAEAASEGEEEEEEEDSEGEGEEPLSSSAAAVSSSASSSAAASSSSAFFNVSSSRRDYLGVSSVPLPLSAPTRKAPASPEAARGAAAAAASPMAAAAVAKQRAAADAERLRATYPAFVVDGSERDSGSGTSPASAASAAAAATAMTMAPVSVHLRRLDPAPSSSSFTSAALHRRAVAEAIVAAPPADVWAVLTDYEALPDIVPSLAACELVARVKVVKAAPATAAASSAGGSGGASGGATTANSTTARARIRQVAYKRMQYVELHAEALLDVAEREGREVQFRQVRGDFDALQGKWMVVPLSSEGLPLDDDDGDGGDSTSAAAAATSTLLRYAVEVKVSRSAAVLRFLEPLLEAAVAEDVPKSLAALGVAAEQRARRRRQEEEDASSSRPRRLPEMAEDFEVLAAELRRCFGERGAAEANAAAAGNSSSSSSSSSTSSAPPEMPTRAALRALARGGATLERAIASHGGAAAVGSRMGWLPPFRPRKPAGYWESSKNLRKELVAFVRQSGLRPGTMPTKTDMRRARRRDLLRAVERRGGIYAVAQELFGASRRKEGGARQWRMPTRAGAAEWNAHLRAVAAANPEQRGARLFEAAAASFDDNAGGEKLALSSSSPSSGLFGGRARASAALDADSWDSEGDGDYDEDDDEREEEGEEDEEEEAAGLALLDSDEDLVLADTATAAAAGGGDGSSSSSAPPAPPRRSPPLPASPKQQQLQQQPKSKSGTRRSLRDEIDQW